MRKCSNPGESVREEGRNSGAVLNFDNENANSTNGIPKLIYVGSFIQIGQWENCRRTDLLTDVENQRYMQPKQQV